MYTMYYLSLTMLLNRFYHLLCFYIYLLVYIVHC
nr:MAG TPA: hypothetical protein [Caudoviricetes sp.]